MTATQELVVPRSIPIILAIIFSPLNRSQIVLEANKCFVINVVVIANSAMLRPEWNTVKV
jgi:hypothetical protein